jgi:hypothetical protein
MTRFRLIRRSGAIDRSTAWGCLTSNLALPGSGSLLAGRVSGYGQVLLALVGAVITTVFGLRFVVWVFSHWTQLQDADLDPLERLLTLWLGLRWALVGMAVFVIAWLWALGSSVGILRGAGRTGTPPPHILGR